MENWDAYCQTHCLYYSNRFSMINLHDVCFIDLEVAKHTQQIQKIAALCGHNELATTSIGELRKFINDCNPKYLCGHNFIQHDYKYLIYSSLQDFLRKIPVIDTLLCSILFFPDKTVHRLEKPYKSEINIENDPLADCQQTLLLLNLLIEHINKLPRNFKNVIFQLVKNDERFSGIFGFFSREVAQKDFLADLGGLFELADVEKLKDISINQPSELAIAASYLYHRQKSLAPYILHKFPGVVKIIQVINNLRAPLDVAQFAQQEFGIGSFRSFSGLKSDELLADDVTTISQRDIVEAALTNESILAILPTGGGKTFTFQLPALIKAQEYKGLTIVISPLQALMKNHIDGFKSNNFKAVAISGYLSPVERMDALEVVMSGTADILYLAPEALRSNGIVKVLKKRVIERFVIDEAHCFSSWGHDFRHDYNYIATVIKELQEQEFQPPIAVSCFTATAKPEVLQDIKDYFKNKLNLDLKSYIAESERSNLFYSVIRVNDDKDKYEQLVRELERLNGKACIIYRPQNARGCKELAEQLNQDPRISALRVVIEPFYAKVDDELENGKRVGRNKSQILNDFIDNKVNIVVATTAFGMGIDKPDIEAVIHYDPSDSIEAYMQEAGRGARSSDINAECILFYANSDFNRIFTQLNRSKLDYEEIRRIVSAFKKEKQSEFTITTRQIAESIGIDTEDCSLDHETIIKTAILELEKANVINRGRDKTIIFATSVKSTADKSAMEYVHEILDPKKEHYIGNYELMILIMQNIIQRSKVEPIEISELAYIIGSETKVVFRAIESLQKEGLIDYENDISIFITNNVKNELIRHFAFENTIWEQFNTNLTYGIINLRELNQLHTDDHKILQNKIKDAKKVIRSWQRLSSFRHQNSFKAKFNQDVCRFTVDDITKLRDLITARYKICMLVIEELSHGLNGKNEIEVEIPVNKLFHQLQDQLKISLDGFHHCLVYLHDLLDGFKLRKGRLIYHHSLKISKLPRLSERRPYQKGADYSKSLLPYYQRKIESVHILIKLIEMILNDGWNSARHFVADYFALSNQEFKKKYALASSYLPVTEELRHKILKDVNEEQKAIVQDDHSQAILVLAGPGSGKTKTLVHKIANLITIEQHKPEYFLMLAHSRVAVAEFRERLKSLIGNDAYNMDIMTFHAFALKIAGQLVKTDDDVKNAIEVATNMLNNGYQLPLKTMLVLDEYQDVSRRSYEFIQSIYKVMDHSCKIIAVGDDDQCINNFPGADGADIAFMEKFALDFGNNDNEDESDNSSNRRSTKTFAQYSLANNYRSQANLVEFASVFANKIPHRLKTTPLIAKRNGTGQISLYRYNKEHGLITAATQYVINNKLTDCALLFRSNEEVLTAYSLLHGNGIKARYLVDNDGFNLGQLYELQMFLKKWSEKGTFNAAEQWFNDNFINSADYNLAKQVIDNFYNQYENEIARAETHFMGVFSDYLDEIEFGEFSRNEGGIIVATMHKSKGKEFNNVVVVANQVNSADGFDMRLLYVALTRAKNNLAIFTSSSIFDDMTTICSTVENCSDTVLPPNKLIYIMKLSDIWLQYDAAQYGIKETRPLAGEKLTIVHTTRNGNSEFTIEKNRHLVAKLAKATVDNRKISGKILEKISEGYTLDKECVVEHVVRWVERQGNREYYQVLCKISLSRAN